MKENCICPYVMENGSWILMPFVGVWFYLKYEKRGEGRSY
jgi:hypothetical protein